MLTVRPKVSELTFRVFARSLHPELFDIFASREIVRKRYRFQVAITSAGHLATWTQGGITLSEVAASSHQLFPTQRQILAQPLSGQYSHELVFEDRVHYQFQFQLEPAEPQTFAVLQNHLLETSEYEGLVYQFESSGRMAYGGLSYMDIQSLERTVRLRSFHTFPDARRLVKSESSFTFLDPCAESNAGGLFEPG